MEAMRSVSRRTLMVNGEIRSAQITILMSVKSKLTSDDLLKRSVVHREKVDVGIHVGILL